MSFPKALSIIIGSAAAVAFMPAMAGSPSEVSVKKVPVSISGYDLNSVEDAETVYGMIQTAAKRACRRSGLRQNLTQLAEERDCRARAVADAVDSLNAPAVTLVMNQDNGTAQR